MLIAWGSLFVAFGIGIPCWFACIKLRCLHLLFIVLPNGRGARSVRPRALRLLYCCKRLVQHPLLIKQMKGGKYSILQIISHTFHLRALLAVFILKFGIAEAGLGTFAEDRDDLLADRARVVFLDDGDILILAAKVLIPFPQPFV